MSVGQWCSELSRICRYSILPNDQASTPSKAVRSVCQYFRLIPVGSPTTNPTSKSPGRLCAWTSVRMARVNDNRIVRNIPFMNTDCNRELYISCLIYYIRLIQYV